MPNQSTPKGPNPSGLCMCGCGNPAPIASHTSRKHGRVKGTPNRFIWGHHAAFRLTPEQYAIDPVTGCWNWKGAKYGNGYGKVMINGRMKSAHAVVYERLRGPIPKGHEGHHRCRNKGCINPDHVEVLTKAKHRKLHEADVVAGQRRARASGTVFGPSYETRVILAAARKRDAHGRFLPRELGS